VRNKHPIIHRLQSYSTNVPGKIIFNLNRGKNLRAYICICMFACVFLCVHSKALQWDLTLILDLEWRRKNTEKP
jgi:hypothetical protein